jgi:hypothetical protein
MFINTLTKTLNNYYELNQSSLWSRSFTATARLLIQQSLYTHLVCIITSSAMQPVVSSTSSHLFFDFLRLFLAAGVRQSDLALSVLNEYNCNQRSANLVAYI